MWDGKSKALKSNSQQGVLGFPLFPEYNHNSTPNTIGGEGSVRKDVNSVFCVICARVGLWMPEIPLFLRCPPLSVRGTTGSLIGLYLFKVSRLDGQELQGPANQCLPSAMSKNGCHHSLPPLAPRVMGSEYLTQFLRLARGSHLPN